MKELAPIGLFLIFEGLGSMIKSTDQRTLWNAGRLIRIIFGTILVII